MERIVGALVKALVSLLHPKIFWLMIWPVIVALVVWVTLALLYWGQAVSWIDVQLHQSALIEWTITIWPFTLIAAWLGWVLLLFLFVPLVLITAVLIVGLVSMPAMAVHVGERDYPGLARREGGTLAGGVWNVAVALVLFLALAVVTLPLWFIPLLWPVIPLLLLGYFNQRVFAYDALAEHGSAAEIAAVIRRCRGEMFLLGVALALIGHIPLLGLFMPVYGGLAFIHYGLERLRELRSDPIDGSATRV